MEEIIDLKVKQSVDLPQQPPPASLMMPRPSIDSVMDPLDSSTAFNSSQLAETKATLQRPTTKEIVHDETTVEKSALIVSEPAVENDTLAVIPGESGREFFHRSKTKLRSSDTQKFLGKPNAKNSNFWDDFRQALFESFPLRAVPIVKALENLTSKIPMPIEGQQIDRVLRDFAISYHRMNAEVFDDWEHIYFLLCIILMFNTQLWKRSTGPMLTLDEAIRLFESLKGDAHREITRIVLESIFKRLKKGPIRGYEPILDDILDMDYVWSKTVFPEIPFSAVPAGNVLESAVEGPAVSLLFRRLFDVHGDDAAKLFPAGLSIRSVAPRAKSLRDHLHMRIFFPSKAALFHCDALVRDGGFSYDADVEKQLSMSNTMSRFTTWVSNMTLSRRPSVSVAFAANSSNSRRQSNNFATMRTPKQTNRPTIPVFGSGTIPEEKVASPLMDLNDLSMLRTSFLTSIHFMTSLLYFSINRKPIEFECVSDEKQVKFAASIANCEHALTSHLGAHSFNGFMDMFKESYSSMKSCDVIIASGPVLRKNSVSQSSLEIKEGAWKGNYACLVIPATVATTTAKPELWIYDETGAKDLEKRAAVLFQTVESHFCQDIEAGLAGNVSTGSSLSIAQEEDSKKLANSFASQRFLLPPTRKRPVINSVAFEDCAYEKYANVFTLAYPREFPCPLNGNLHNPPVKKGKNEQQIKRYMGFLNRIQDSKMTMSIDMNLETFMSMLFRGVILENTITINGEQGEPKQPSKAFQWQMHLNCSAAISTFLADFHNLINSDVVRCEWSLFTQLVRNHYIKAVHDWNYAIADIPVALNWLRELPEGERKSLHEQCHMIKLRDEQQKSFRETFIQLAPYIDSQVTALFDLIVKIDDIETGEGVGEVHIKQFEAISRWINAMYNERRCLMRDKVESCTRHLNQLGMAQLIYCSKQTESDGDTLQMAEFVLHPGAPQRRGSVATNLHHHHHHHHEHQQPQLTDKQETRSDIRKQMCVIEEDIEWSRIEYERWTTYTDIINLCIDGMQLK